MAYTKDDETPTTDRIERGTARSLYNFGLLDVPEDVKELRRANEQMRADLNGFFRAFASIFKSAGGEAEKFMPSRSKQHK